MLEAKFPCVTILIDEATTIRGIRVYASPYQPYFNNWAFQFAPKPAGGEQAEVKWASIPDDTEILVTHGPPHGVLDTTLSGHHAGCVALKARIANLSNLHLHVFGHVHEGYGSTHSGNALFVNASTCDAKYQPTQSPIVVDSESGAVCMHEL